MRLLPLSPISFSEEQRDIFKRRGLNNDPSSRSGSQREKKKNNFTELALNIWRQSGESGQQMVVRMAGTSRGGVTEDRGREWGHRTGLRGSGHEGKIEVREGSHDSSRWTEKEAQQEVGTVITEKRQFYRVLPFKRDETKV